MRRKKLSIGTTVVLAIFTSTLFMTVTRATAQEENVLHSFGPYQGSTPAANLIFDSAGNLYGTTSAGGIGSGGTVFELMPIVGGGWTEKVLHNFNRNGTDGYYPYASLIFDTAGNLYGTTVSGGAYNWGLVFELTPTAGGGWIEKALHSFNNNGTDGNNPYSALIFDPAGNLYGTTLNGGAYNLGTVFELSPRAGGHWTEKILHNFANGIGGSGPYAALIMDAGGNLYGATPNGGAYSGGTVFELTPEGGGWKERVLHAFGNGTDGAFPDAGVIFDADGNLYGTTVQGGTNANYYGTVFELTPAAGGLWTETALHNFNQNGTDGQLPAASLIFDAAGNLYSTTVRGGAYQEGTIFELTPVVGGSWTETILYNFNNVDRNAFNPQTALIFDAAGNLYGTTAYGGIYAYGTVFEITP
jgi:uncharacterized repeat protein (TIGR03803 family)